MEPYHINGSQSAKAIGYGIGRVGDRKHEGVGSRNTDRQHEEQRVLAYALSHTGHDGHEESAHGSIAGELSEERDHQTEH